MYKHTSFTFDSNTRWTFLLVHCIKITKSNYNSPIATLLLLFLPLRIFYSHYRSLFELKLETPTIAFLYLQTHPPTLLQHTKRLILSLNLLHKEHSGCHTPFFLYGVQLRLDTKLSLWHANSPEETNAVLNEVNTIHQQVQTTEEGDHYSFFRWWFG